MKYKCLTRVKTADEKIHNVGDVIELTDKEAQVCAQFRSVARVQESAPDAKKAAEKKSDKK